MKRRNPIFVLYHILQNTDEEHQMTMKEILCEMELLGCQSSRYSVGRYMKQMMEEENIEIMVGRGRGAKYYLNKIGLEKETVAILSDMIVASKIFDKQISRKVIEQLTAYTSIHRGMGKAYTRQLSDILKIENEKILYVVSDILEAMNQGVQIQFQYMEWTTKKKLEVKGDRIYTVNPWKLFWKDDRYYLFGYDVKETDGELKERHYRVDKMKNITLLKSKRENGEQFEKLDIELYVSKRIGMFSGREEKITALVPQNLVGVFLDQFGIKIQISKKKDVDNRYTISFYAVPSNNLYGWLHSFVGVEVVRPLKIRNEIIEHMRENYRIYTEKEL